MDLCFDCCTDCVCSWFLSSSPVAKCSVKVDGALSSLSGAVGGPVWLNGQSMKPLLAGCVILKMYLLIVLKGTLKYIHQIEAVMDQRFLFIILCHTFAF